MLTVCIVEDREDIRGRLVRRVAEMPLVRVLGDFGSGAEALEHLPRLRPDLTILDIGLPDVRGTEVLERLLRDGFEGAFVMFTVFDHDEELFRALELGAGGYILKHEGASGVVEAVDEFRRGGAPMSRRVAQRVLRSFRGERPGRRTKRLEALTPQQHAILELLSEGLLNKEIGARLGLTEATVKQHNVRIYRKLSVNNRAEAIRLFLTA